MSGKSEEVTPSPRFDSHMKHVGRAQEIGGYAGVCKSVGQSVPGEGTGQLVISVDEHADTDSTMRSGGVPVFENWLDWTQSAQQETRARRHVVCQNVGQRRICAREAWMQLEIVKELCVVRRAQRRQSSLSQKNQDGRRSRV